MSHPESRPYTQHDLRYSDGTRYAIIATEKARLGINGEIIKPDASLHLSSGPYIMISRKQAVYLLRRAKERGSKITTRWQTY